MSKWLTTLDIQDVWLKTQEGNFTPQKLAGEIAAKLQVLKLAIINRKYPDYYVDVINEREDLVMAFESMADDKELTVEDIDNQMYYLYNWADQKFKNENFWSDKLCWVKTF